MAVGRSFRLTKEEERLADMAEKAGVVFRFDDLQRKWFYRSTGKVAIEETSWYGYFATKGRALAEACGHFGLAAPTCGSAWEAGFDTARQRGGKRLWYAFPRWPGIDPAKQCSGLRTLFPTRVDAAKFVCGAMKLGDLVAKHEARIADVLKSAGDEPIYKDALTGGSGPGSGR